MAETQRRGRAASALLAAAVLAGACGSSNAEEASPAGAPGAKTAPAAGSSDPATWGVKEKTLVGPAGFRADLSACPAKWSDTAGLVDNEIRVAQSFVQSGSLAPFGQIVTGMKNYFDYVNETEGGVAGKRLTLITKDDGYEAARATSNVAELLETADPFVFATLAGTPANLATYDTINDACIPDLMVSSGHPAWGDPVNHPWVMGSFLPYSTEAQIWGAHLSETLGRGATVAALAMNNDFGATYRAEFERYAAANGLNLLRVVTHDPAAPNVTNELTTLASTNADAVILMTTSTYCTQAFKALAESTWKPKLKYVSQTCSGIQTYFKPAGAAGADWIIAGSMKDVSDPEEQGDPFVKAAKAQLAKANLDPNSSQLGNGWWYAWGAAEVLRNAAKLAGGLTRTNVMLAARSLNTEHPMGFKGIRFATNGNLDAYPVEGAQLTKYSIAPGQEAGAHRKFGKPIDLDGQTAPCPWNGKTC
ncbi:MAG: ABC transporter substrate-binding protein [Acidimicrobiales bacterium]